MHVRATYTTTSACGPHWIQTNTWRSLWRWLCAFARLWWFDLWLCIVVFFLYGLRLWAVTCKHLLDCSIVPWMCMPTTHPNHGWEVFRYVAAVCVPKMMIVLWQPYTAAIARCVGNIVAHLFVETNVSDFSLENVMWFCSYIKTYLKWNVYYYYGSLSLVHLSVCAQIFCRL